MKYKVNNVKNVCADLKQFCYLAQDEDFITVTEWSNGDGFCINIDRKASSQTLQLTRGEIEAIVFLTKALEGDID